MSIRDALVAPTGVQNQMVGQPSRVPGYSQGLGQAPGQMALPPEPMPIGRPTAVVGGPAYFTPQGYNAPPQPTEAFMPTDRMPDPIGQQFMRQMQSPMGQQFQQQYEATQAPIREAEAAARAEAQAAQDARFQEMMDRIAELEGQLATPTEPIPDVTLPTDPYIPGGPFPGIPDFIRDLDFSNIDFSNLPDFSNLDYDDIMNQYRDRMEMGEPEPIDSFLPDPRDLPPMRLMPVDEPRFTTMPVPDGPRGPGMSIGDMLEGRVTRMPVGDSVPFAPPVMPGPDRDKPIEVRIAELGGRTPPNIPKIPKIPTIPNIDFSNIPTPESFSESPDFMPGSGMGRIGQGVATDRESLIGKTLFGQTITPESFAGRETAKSPFFRATPRPDLPTPNISGPFGFIKNSPTIDERPMIPSFGNINLR